MIAAFYCSVHKDVTWVHLTPYHINVGLAWLGCNYLQWKTTTVVVDPALEKWVAVEIKGRASCLRAAGGNRILTLYLEGSKF